MVIYIKNDEGFTLIEVILSILILAIVSAIVIQLYITANEVSEHAKETDWAVTQTSSAVEILEAFDSPYEAMTHKFYAQGEIESNDSFNLSNTIYFDESYEVTDLSNAVYTLKVQMAPKEVPSILTKEITGTSIEEINVMMLIDAQLIDGEGKVLSQHTLGHYYTFER